MRLEIVVSLDNSDAEDNDAGNDVSDAIAYACSLRIVKNYGCGCELMDGNGNVIGTAKILKDYRRKARGEV